MAGLLQGLLGSGLYEQHYVSWTSTFKGLYKL